MPESAEEPNIGEKVGAAHGALYAGAPVRVVNITQVPKPQGDALALLAAGLPKGYQVRFITCRARVGGEAAARDETPAADVDDLRTKPSWISVAGMWANLHLIVVWGEAAGLDDVCAAIVRCIGGEILPSPLPDEIAEMLGLTPAGRMVIGTGDTGRQNA